MKLWLFIICIFLALQLATATRPFYGSEDEDSEISPDDFDSDSHDDENVLESTETSSKLTAGTGSKIVPPAAKKPQNQSGWGAFLGENESSDEDDQDSPGEEDSDDDAVFNGLKNLTTSDSNDEPSIETQKQPELDPIEALKQLVESSKKKPDESIKRNERKMLGEGADGKVYLSTDGKHAVKVVEIIEGGETTAEHVMQEIQILNLLPEEHAKHGIVRYDGCRMSEPVKESRTESIERPKRGPSTGQPVGQQAKEDEKPVVEIVFEAMEGVTLDRFQPKMPEQILNFKVSAAQESHLDKLVRLSTFSKAQIIKVAHQVLEVLEYLHDPDLSIIHGDIRPTNIFLTCDGAIKVFDFGGGQSFGDVKPNAVASEGFTHPKYESAVDDGILKEADYDLYSLGATLHVLLTGSLKVDYLQNMKLEELDKLSDWTPADEEELKNLGKEKEEDKENVTISSGKPNEPTPKPKSAKANTRKEEAARQERNNMLVKRYLQLQLRKRKKYEPDFLPLIKFIRRLLAVDEESSFADASEAKDELVKMDINDVLKNTNFSDVCKLACKTAEKKD